MMTQRTLDTLISKCQAHIEPLLRKALPPLTEQSHEATCAMHYACLNGGKRIRPLLAFLIAELFERHWSEVDPLAICIEMIHCYSLIHDDLPAMDNDDLRRGLPTCHKRFGEATAILAGDALLTLAFEVLSHDDSFQDKALQCRIIHTIAKRAGTQGMVTGQVLDLSAAQRHYNLEQLIEMHRAKTGALIEAVVQCAAWICGATLPEKLALDCYAQNLGLAFQVQDDLLDAIGDSKVMGKQAGQDVKNETCTFVTLLGVEKTREFAQNCINNALNSIACFGERNQRLKELAMYIVKRTT